MPLGGFNAGTWDETIPAGGESVGRGDDRIRSVKTTVRQALDSEHVWSSSGGTIGQHRAGSGRAFFGLQSALSASDTSTVADGRLMVTSNTSRLFGVNSEGPVMLGAGPLSLSMDTTNGPGPGTNTRWVVETGVIGSKSSTHNVTFPSSGFSGTPYIQVSIYTQTIGGADPGRVFKLDTVSASGFSGQVVNSSNNVADPAGIMWVAIGVRAQ